MKLEKTQKSTAKPPVGPFQTQGNRIVDSTGTAIQFSGLNWFGFETANNAPHGLWTRNWQDLLDQVRDLGYNSLRLPFSNAMLRTGVTPSGIDYTLNPDLAGLTSLEVMDRLIEGARQRGLWVILDNHRSTSGGGPETGGMWYTSQYPESRWIEDWKMLANRYKANPAVVAVDLRNEPYGGCWGCGDPAKDWRLAAEKAGNAILEINLHWLVIVEGVSIYNGQSTWWGGNLMGAGEFPVRLNIPNRLVYSAHEYPESVAYQPWFNDPNYPANLPAVWDQFWGYLVRQNIAPVLIGEFGTRYETVKDRQWLAKFQAYIQQQQLHWTFWSLNPNSGDTGGLLLDDWQSVHPEKQAILAQIQYSSGGSTPPAPTPTPGNRIQLPVIQNSFSPTRLGLWKTFHDLQSLIQLEAAAGNEAVRVTYSITPGGWGGIEQKFSQSRDWSGGGSLRFRLEGSSSGNRIRVEVLDNRLPGNQDTSERFEAFVVDDFTGWRDFSLPWSAFQRRLDWQPDGAPNDGFGLISVWGFNFAPVEGSGRFSVEIE